MVQFDEDGFVKGKRSGDVIDAAFRLFSHAAIDTISMTDIADEARIGVATIYRYFGTKQNLLILTGTRALRRRITKVKKRYDEHDMMNHTGYEQIEFLIMNFVNDYEELGDLLRFSANLDQYFLSEDIDAEVLVPYRETMSYLFEMLYHAFDLAIAQGDVSKEYADRDSQVCGIISLMGAAQKYATNGIICGTNQETHKKWLIDQAKMYLYVLGGGSSSKA